MTVFNADAIATVFSETLINSGATPGEAVGLLLDLAALIVFEMVESHGIDHRDAIASFESKIMEMKRTKPTEECCLCDPGTKCDCAPFQTRSDS